MKKPVCNRSSASHAASARSKYYRRVTLCLVATLIIASSTAIIIPSARLYWAFGWIPVLCYFVWRYWISLRLGGYFECDACWKLKHAKHIKAFHDPTSGETHVWCDRCLKSMRQVARSMRQIRLLIAGLLRSGRNGSKHQVPKPYTPMARPQLVDPQLPDQHLGPKVVIAFRKPESQDFQVSSPGFAKR